MWWRTDPSMLEEINVQGTANLVAAAMRAGVKRFVYVSSTEAIGPSPRY